MIEKNSPFANNRLDYVLNLLGLRKVDKILNIGVSNIPQIEQIIENKVKECTTIDIDKKKMESAKKYLKNTNLIFANVMDKLPFKKNYFDKVIVLEVFEHLKDDKLAMQNINKVMKQNGILILSVPNDSFIHIINPVKYAEHERHYSNELIIKNLKESGFKVEHFNLVENITLILNVYIHLFIKFILRQQREFGFFKKSGNNTYGQINNSGVDIIIKARKVKSFD